jgi:hypothetical protein
MFFCHALLFWIIRCSFCFFAITVIYLLRICVWMIDVTYRERWCNMWIFHIICAVHPTTWHHSIMFILSSCTNNICVHIRKSCQHTYLTTYRRVSWNLIHLVFTEWCRFRIHFLSLFINFLEYGKYWIQLCAAFFSTVLFWKMFWVHNNINHIIEWEPWAMVFIQDCDHKLKFSGHRACTIATDGRIGSEIWARIRWGTW